MIYPFEFKVLHLTDKVLDKLGFSEYWDGPGDFGDRRLDLGAQKEDKRLVSKQQYPAYLIHVIDEQDQDEASGQGYGEPEYVPYHFTTKDFQKALYFLHDMYEDIAVNRTPEELQVFFEITKKKGINMWPFLSSYLEYKKMESHKTRTFGDYKHTQS